MVKSVVTQKPPLLILHELGQSSRGTPSTEAFMNYQKPPNPDKSGKRVFVPKPPPYPLRR